MKISLLALIFFTTPVMATDQCSSDRIIIRDAAAKCDIDKDLWVGRGVAGYLEMYSNGIHSTYRCHTTANGAEHGAFLNRYSATVRTACAPMLPAKGGGQSGGDSLCGSIVELTNQVLGETIPVTGAPFSLIYKSDRVIGRGKDYKIAVPVFAGIISSAVSNMNLMIKDGAGTTLTNINFSPLANTNHIDQWMGLIPSRFLSGVKKKEELLLRKQLVTIHLLRPNKTFTWEI